MSETGKLEFSLRREPTLLRALGLTRTKLPALSEYVQEPEAYREPHVVDWALGAVLMMSRECFDALGGWDESFFLYSEETDLSLRGQGTWVSPPATSHDPSRCTSAGRQAAATRPMRCRPSTGYGCIDGAMASRPAGATTG